MAFIILPIFVSIVLSAVAMGISSMAYASIVRGFPLTVIMIHNRSKEVHVIG